MFTFDDFRAKVRSDGLARQNRFYISISPPNLNGETARLFSGGSQELRDLHLLCKSVTIPGVTVTTAPVRYTGEQFEAPYDRAFGAATFTFYVDRKMIVRKFFEDWVYTIQDHQTRTLGWYKDFTAPSIVVYVCDRQSRAVYAHVLYDAHIKTVGNLQLDQSTNDVMTFDATIDYHYSASILIDQPDVPAEQSSRSRRLDREGGVSPSTQTPTPSVDPATFLASISDSSPEMINPMDSFLDSLGLGSFTENFTEFQDTFSQGLGELTYAGQSLIGSINQAYGVGMQQFNGIKSAASSLINGAQQGIGQVSGAFSQLSTSLSGFGFGGGGG